MFADNQIICIKKNTFSSDDNLVRANRIYVCIYFIISLMMARIGLTGNRYNLKF